MQIYIILLHQGFKLGVQILDMQDMLTDLPSLSGLPGFTAENKLDLFHEVTVIPIQRSVASTESFQLLVGPQHETMSGA